MGGYIRMDKDLGDDPRVLRLADGVPGGVNEILGGLYRLWRYADTYLELDRIQVRYSDLEKVTGLPLQVLKIFPLQWLSDNGDGTVSLPNYGDKNGLLDKEYRREQTRLRVRKWRNRKRNIRNASPKRQSNAGNRPGNACTGTGTGPSQTGPGTEGLAVAREGREGPSLPLAESEKPDPEKSARRRAELKAKIAAMAPLSRNPTRGSG